MNKDEVVRKILDAATTGKHSDAVKALNEFGEAIWKDAQADAAKLITRLKTSTSRSPLYCKTPYKP